MVGLSRSNRQLPLYLSAPHECSYLPDRQSSTLFADPDQPMDMATYEDLLHYGFRRSGSLVYAPNCPYCSACQSVRVPVEKFCANRSQRRALQKNSDLTISRRTARFQQEHYELYRQYIHARHSGSSMENPSPDDYLNFLSSDWSETYFYEFRKQEKLVAVAVADQLSNGLSAVYTFYDPDESQRSLGKFAILKLIADTRERGMKWFYLGYWIDGCQKMQYKIEYQPTEIFFNARWNPFP